MRMMLPALLIFRVVKSNMMLPLKVCIVMSCSINGRFLFVQPSQISINIEAFMMFSWPLTVLGLWDDKKKPLKHGSVQVESNNNKCALLANHWEKEKRWVWFCVCGGVKQGLERLEVWVARWRGKNVSLRRNNKQSTETGTEKRYRK